MDDTAIKSRLRSLIGDLLHDVADFPDVQLEDRTFLPDVLDSEAMASLVVLIEDEWGFAIADEDIELRMFADLVALTNFVSQRLRAANG